MSPRSFRLPAPVRRLDVRIAQRVNAHASSGPVDSVLRDLSRAADHSKLWILAAGALALTGTRSRRGAVRGLASVAVASAAANLVGKGLVGGERPALDTVPVPRRLRRTPTSGSFPSGHSASAAAFAFGVAVENPAAAVVVAPVAAAVAYSRIHTGAHWGSDVAGGVLTGVAAAGLLALVRPAHTDHSQPGPILGLPALPDGAGLFMVVNPHSGSVWRPRRKWDERDLRKVFAELPEATIHELSGGDDVAELFSRAAESGRYRALGVAGGDGTLAAAATVAAEHDLPLFIAPFGTLNHFARTAGIDHVADALESVRAGVGVQVDLAHIDTGDDDPQVVLNTMSLGLYPEFVAEREKHEKRLGKRLASLVAAARIVPREGAFDAELDGRPRRIRSLFVGIGVYGRHAWVPGERDRLDSGLLDVRILDECLHVERYQAKSLTLAVARPHRLATDGEVDEPSSDRTATLSIRPGALRIYAPESWRR